MVSIKNSIPRKKFIAWTGGFLFLFTAFKLNLFSKKQKHSIKFLTEDGKLVEVDPKHLNKKGSKIYTSDIYSWIKHK
ncbi:MAG: hypothetical protein JNL65_01385 [Saprospiraceae bacterium]|nr:hypothetical protein [Saprospiraceae bacterium]